MDRMAIVPLGSWLADRLRGEAAEVRWRRETRKQAHWHCACFREEARAALQRAFRS